MNNDVDTILVSVDDAMKLLAVGRTTIYQLVADGEIPAAKLRGRRVFRRRDIEQFAERLFNRGDS